MIMAEAKTKPKAAKKPAQKPAQTKDRKPAEKKPQAKAAHKTKEEAAKKPAEKAGKQPAEKKQEKTSEKPQEKPAEKPKSEEKKTASRPKAEKKEEKPKKEVKVKKEYAVAKIEFLPKPSEKAPSKGKPAFRRQEAGRYKRLKEVWRRPTGIDSKKLEKQRGKGMLPSIGYKKPSDESGLHAGFEAVRVFNAAELKVIAPSTQAAVIASAVGRRKRNIIIAEANRLKITILNPRRGEA
jgi:large subunit ribosomal protein L32e